MFDDNASVRKLDVKGYQSAQEVTEEDRISLMVTREISPIKPAVTSDIMDWGKEECFQYLDKHHVPFAFKWKEMYDTEEDEGDTDETDIQENVDETEDYESYCYISYWLSSDVLSGEELKEIAEEMQGAGDR